MMLSALFSSSSFLPLNIPVAYLPSLEVRFSQNYYYSKILLLSHKSASRLFLYIWSSDCLSPTKTLYIYVHPIASPYFVLCCFTQVPLRPQASIQILMELHISTPSTETTLLLCLTGTCLELSTIYPCENFSSYSIVSSGAFAVRFCWVVFRKPSRGHQLNLSHPHALPAPHRTPKKVWGHTFSREALTALLVHRFLHTLTSSPF